MFLNVASIRDEQDLDKHLTQGAWPVSEEEKLAVYLQMLDGCKEFLLAITDRSDQNVFRTLAPMLIGHVFSIVYSNAVVERVGSTDSIRSVYRPSEIDYFSYPLLGQRFDENLAANHLKRHANLKKKLKALLVRGNRTRSIERVISPNPTLKVVLQDRKIDQLSLEFPEIFSIRTLAPRDTVSEKNATFGSQIYSALVGPLTEKYINRDVEKAILAFIQRSVEYVRYQIGVLLAGNGLRTIRMLHTGNQGYLGTRLASIVVIEHGGSVLGYPHSGAMHIWPDNRWLIDELTVTHAFYYTEWERKLKARLNSALRKKFPIVTSQLAGEAGRDINKRPPLNSKRRIENVLYIGAGYAGDRPFPLVLPEPIRLALEVSILDQLIEMNLNITLKFHRKSRLQDQLTRVLFSRYEHQVEYVDEPLTEFLKNNDRFDAYVSENLLGGSLSEVIKTEKPVILVSPFTNYLSPEVLQRFSERVRIVPCKKTSRGMYEVDRTKLSEAFVTSENQKLSMKYTHRATNPGFDY